MALSPSPAQAQFVALLREMFQIQDLDLNFGIYRVLNQERKLIERFLDERLAPIVREALGAADDTQRAALESEMAALAKTLEDAGVAPDSAPKYADLKRQADAQSGSASLENEVFNGLADFFGRYYDSGDFLSRPRYRKDVYALPYNGEEVKLHWANRDQYYIKSAQVLESFDWNLGEQKVRFALREAGTAENNNKEERRFVLALGENEQPVVTNEGGVLTVFFDFKKAEGKGGPRDLNAAAEKRLQEWSEGRELVAPLLAPWNTSGKSHFLHRLNSWTARGSFDFFVHKDLRGFLSRELDFFLKNEVVRLDALFAGDGSAWEKTTLAKARAMHALGGKIIEFLASLEELQKRLWEKQKWVTQSRAILPLKLIPESLLPQVLASTPQHAEWKSLYGVDSEPISTVNPAPWSEPPTQEWALCHPDIAVDTQHFDEEWTRRLWSELSKAHDSLDDLWNGVLWNADNFAALNLMQKRFGEQVKCIYVDPPYNTGKDDFLYKDAYQHSSWLSMMQDRLT
jgi:adenine-specific DNA-methyltransferase